MRFSFNWLKMYLQTEYNVSQIADNLTYIGLEVENVIDPDVIFKNFKLVKITKVEPHPNADRLKLCEAVDADDISYRIVCGASNVRQNLKTLLALPGAYIPSAKETLKKSKIRDVVSEGMLCSFDELNMESDNDGIIEFPENLDLLTSLGDAFALDGGIIDVSLTPNRGDCFSVRGIARDLAAIGCGEFKNLEQSKNNVICDSNIKINFHKTESSICYMPAASFMVMHGLKNNKSPDWLVNRLKISGINSISLIVDLANYVMIDIGRPLHIYDLDKINGDISIRFAQMHEQFVDLCDKEHSLKQDILVASDDDGVLSVLGIIGSKRVACDANTTNVLIESALFNQVFISRAGAYLNICSDARTRFERGIDKNSNIEGIEYVSHLFKKYCGGEVGELISIGNTSVDQNRIVLHKDKLDSISGINIDFSHAKKILCNLGFDEICSTNNSAEFLVPTWRNDVSIEENLISEILRIYGYDKINCTTLNNNQIFEDKLLFERKKIISFKRVLASRGISEIVSYSFNKLEYASVFKEEKKLIHLLNPITTDFSVMRPSLLPNLLMSAIKSINFGKPNEALFEEGNVFFNSSEQERHIAGIRVGNYTERSWNEQQREVNVFDIKSDIFAVLERINHKDIDINITLDTPSYYHPYRSGCLRLSNNKIIGYFGALHPKINNLFKVSLPFVVFELFLKNIFFMNTKKYSYVDKIYPKITRDFAFIFDEKKSLGNMINEIYKLDDIITDVKIFDNFLLSFNKKSIGISVVLEDLRKTLTENDAACISDKIINFVQKNGGELRTQ